MSVTDQILLDRIFGAGATGQTAQERARVSTRRFVRSQSQLALMTDRAKGLEVSPETALALVGLDGLLHVIKSGAVVINPSLREPSDSFRIQREELGVTQNDLANATGLTVEEVIKAEQHGSISPIRKLVQLGQALGLDDEMISASELAGADRDLSYRLRTMRRARDIKLPASLVLKLSGAAWVISKQAKVADMLKPGIAPPDFDKSDDYTNPAWKRGWELAEKTRNLLSLDPMKPIRSVRALIDHINIPLVQSQLGRTFAGATIQNGGDRGIVVNVDGDNQSVWVRRATLAHELGHLLWDPVNELKHLHVDRYVDLQNRNETGIEARANAFAIAFLAPPKAVEKIIKSDAPVEEQVATLMNTFGIAATAAKHHLSNVSREWGREIDTTKVRGNRLPQPDEDWTSNENWTADVFVVRDVPMDRRGRFSGLIAAAALENRITLDYAASCLGIPSTNISQYLNTIIDLTASDLVSAR